ncbi:uncharacterized protein V6R79_009232 [Siganus canaliculatus]
MCRLLSAPCWLVTSVLFCLQCDDEDITDHDPTLHQDVKLLRRRLDCEPLVMKMTYYVSDDVSYLLNLSCLIYVGFAAIKRIPSILCLNEKLKLHLHKHLHVLSHSCACRHAVYTLARADAHKPTHGHVVRLRQ